jgi:hypothetical protein
VRSLGACIPLLLACACTFEDGTGFGTLEAASLSVTLQPGAARDLGNHSVLSDLGYEVKLETARVTLASVELSELSGAGGEAASFDPAHPPSGYSLCHAGHCHADDGRLVSYEEIQVELAGGNASFAPVASLPVDAPLDLWSTEPRALERVLPSRELPRARLTRLSAGVTELELAGQVSEGPIGAGVGPTPLPFNVVLPLATSFEKQIDLEITRDEPGAFSARVAVTASARLVDGVDWSALAAQSPLTDPEAPLALVLVESLLASNVSFDID